MNVFGAKPLSTIELQSADAAVVPRALACYSDDVLEVTGDPAGSTQKSAFRVFSGRGSAW